MGTPLDPDLPAGREISVVIPAFNEARRIRGTVEVVIAYLEGRFDRFEVIVVDDGSSDATTEEVRAVAHPAVRSLRNGANAGKGHSVRRGVMEARHDPVLFTDADLSTPIEEVEKLLAALREGYDVAIGSRRLAESRVERSILRRLLGWGFAHLTALLAVSGFHDTQCGFKAFRRKAAAAIFPLQTIERWGFDVEILVIARRCGLRIAEVPVRWRQSGDSRVRLRTPLEMGLELLRIRSNALRGKYAPPRVEP
jgi:dolichyl-phosphate beta-glucosyltransferase